MTRLEDRYGDLPYWRDAYDLANAIKALATDQNPSDQGPGGASPLLGEAVRLSARLPGLIAVGFMHPETDLTEHISEALKDLIHLEHSLSILGEEALLVRAIDLSNALAARLEEDEYSDDD